jgi:nucleotide-binding universal stress UspA family protein
MKKILVPFDGSDNSLRALRYVVTLAQEHASLKVELLHVLDPMTVKPDTVMNQEQINHLYEQEADKVLRFARQILDETSLLYEQHFRIGDPANEIAAQVREKECDGVVMGTRGMGQIACLMIGSVATRVVHLVRVPVTLIK